ncbi:MAG: hypothetical protein ABJJ25_00870 [Eudoraea sp.]|uniref:hypothetical protein n=1 Tax=Eudoraea sp. TaxID=1979955 RepID=UPI003267A64B
MSYQIEQNSIEALKSDFPEHQEIIEVIDKDREMFMELATDYYICKRNIQFAEFDKKEIIAKEYRYTLEDLKQEIETFLIKNEVK